MGVDVNETAGGAEKHREGDRNEDPTSTGEPLSSGSPQGCGRWWRGRKLLQGRKENGPEANYVTEDLELDLRATAHAFLAWTQPTQEREGVQPGGMAALKCDLQRVLADQAHVLQSKLLRIEALDTGQAARSAGFTAALGAGARPAKLLTRIGAAVSVLPDDVHHVAFAVDVDADWKRVGVLQWVRRP